jgi:hypothetical protein
VDEASFDFLDGNASAHLEVVLERGRPWLAEVLRQMLLPKEVV